MEAYSSLERTKHLYSKILEDKSEKSHSLRIMKQSFFLSAGYNYKQLPFTDHLMVI